MERRICREALSQGKFSSCGTGRWPVEPGQRPGLQVFDLSDYVVRPRLKAER
jgi:hypothetical protein